MTQPPLWTKNFILAFISNMLIFFSFYLIVPILPFYLMNDMGLDESSAGLVIGIYTISALLVRPFSGFLVDKFARKPLYLLCYTLFALVFGGYAITNVVAIFIILRVLHGAGFGLSTVSGSTVAIDIMPAQRRGEGIGYFGLSYSFAQSIGPMMGFWLYKHYEFNHIFLFAFTVSLLGLLSILPISLPKLDVAKCDEATTEKEPMSLDRFILLKGLPCVLLLFLTGYGYGTVSNFIGLYCESSSFDCNPGFFFMIFAIGVVAARLLSAKPINRGLLVGVISIGAIAIASGFFALAYCYNSLIFIASALLIGVGFGLITPGFQSMLVNLSTANRRGTANATFYTFLDLGIGVGIVASGVIMEHFDFTTLLALCGGLVALGLLYFITISAKHYKESV